VNDPAVIPQLDGGSLRYLTDVALANDWTEVLVDIHDERVRREVKP